ncbi:MAG: dTDP-glucose 4,6-dehydratase [Planctomycetota bacterium]|nr:dTDP-glucose 4,6-dehydratase [Planctomycetota bacterium]
MKILVTGGAGFIGSNLALHALMAGAESVVVYDSLTYAACPETLPPLLENSSFKLIQADIADEASFLHCLQTENPDRVFHLAAESHVDRSLDNLTPFLRTNIEGTRAVLDALHTWLKDSPPHDFLLLHSSTDEVFGALGGDGFFSEDSLPEPRNPYSTTKAAADILVETWAQCFAVPSLISHSGNNYGPFQFPEKLIPLMVQKALRDEPLPVFGNGAQVRDWIHVQDHVTALAALAERGKPRNRYCISSENVCTNLEVVKAVLSCIPSSQSSISFVTDRPGHDFRYASSGAKLRKETGWLPQMTSFKQGIKETVNWYLDHSSWVQSAEMQSGYRGERLGLTNTQLPEGA